MHPSPSAFACALAAMLLAGCGDNVASSPDATACQPNLAPDGTYPGYDYCSTAHFPDFKDPQKRWDGFYPASCAGTEGEDLFACSEQLYWQVFQFDHAGRHDAFLALQALVARADQSGTLNDLWLSRLNFRTGQLGVALFAENGDSSPGPVVQRYLERAVALDPTNDVILEAWLYTVKINGAVVLGQDPGQYLDELWALYQRSPPAVAGTVMVLAAGMSVTSGWPKIAIDLVEHVDPNDCGQWCGWAAYRAPFALPGQYFSYAEVEARSGRREQALAFLVKTRATPRYDAWPLKPAAEAAYGDIDAFMGRFAARGDDQSVTDLLVSGSSAACTVCHAPTAE
jgi:hypothetical protein